MIQRKTVTLFGQPSGRTIGGSQAKNGTAGQYHSLNLFDQIMGSH